MDIVIVEDEDVAAKRLKKRLLEIRPTISIKAILPSVQEAVDWFRSNTCDLIFLDIQLSDGLSFDIFDQVTLSTPIIFTTAYDEYAIQAFDLNSIAYLMKPIRTRDLKKSLDKFSELQTAFSIDFHQLKLKLTNESPDYRKRFLIQVGDEFKKVMVEQISYFYSEQGTTFIRTKQEKSLAIDLSLDALTSTLSPEHFFRINRKYIVRMDAIEEMTILSRNRIQLKLSAKHHPDIDSIVSVERSGDFREWLNS